MAPLALGFIFLEKNGLFSYQPLSEFAIPPPLLELDSPRESFSYNFLAAVVLYAVLC